MYLVPFLHILHFDLICSFLSTDALQVSLLLMGPKEGRLPKCMEFSCLGRFLFADALHGHVTIITKPAYGCLEYVNGKTVYVRKGDQTVQAIYRLGKRIFSPMTLLGRAARYSI